MRPTRKPTKREIRAISSLLERWGLMKGADPSTVILFDRGPYYVMVEGDVRAVMQAVLARHPGVRFRQRGGFGLYLLTCSVYKSEIQPIAHWAKDLAGPVVIVDGVE